MHTGTSLPRHIEIGAVRVFNQDSLEVITTDGGKEVRNLRASDEARRWEISMPHVDITSGDTTDYDAVLALWADTNRGLDTFNFWDFVDDETVKVRFDSPLQVTAPSKDLRHIDTFTIKEVIGE
jgi:hypothetical protein